MKEPLVATKKPPCGYERAEATKSAEAHESIRSFLRPAQLASLYHISFAPATFVIFVRASDFVYAPHIFVLHSWLRYVRKVFINRLN